MEGEQPTADRVDKLGFSKIWLIIIIILVLIIAGGAGYFFLFKKSESGSGTISSLIPKSLNPTCKYNDPDLCKFINGWKEVKYLTMNSTDTSKDGKTTTAIFKMEGENNTQMIMSDGNKESYNTITINKTTYTKDYSDNKWFKYTPKESDEHIYTDEDMNIDFDEKAEETEDKTTYQKIGTEACGKLTCFKYKVIDPANTDYTQYIYFDNKDYQLRKTRTEMKDGSVSEATYDYSKFSIGAPSPVKEGDPYGALFNSPTNTITPSTETTTPSTPSPTNTNDSSLDIPASSDTNTATNDDITNSSTDPVIPAEIPSYDIGE